MLKLIRSFKLGCCWLFGLITIGGPVEVVKQVILNQLKEVYKEAGSVLNSHLITYGLFFVGIVFQYMGVFDYLSKEIKKRCQAVFDTIPDKWLPFGREKPKPENPANEKPKPEIIDVHVVPPDNGSKDSFFSPIIFIVALNFLLVAVYLFGKLFFQPFKWIGKRFFKWIRRKFRGY